MKDTEEQLENESSCHQCPFQCEINGNYDDYCDCDEEQTHECRMDI
jgi:hypothetical protein